MRDRLLIRHFLWRFVEHDLVSPNTDRRDLLAVAGGTIVTASLFVSVLVASRYQFDPGMPPGLASINSLDDRFLLVSGSMLIAALAAVAQWDALVLDARDTAVLGVLPIPKSVIVRTKFVATAIFGASVIVAANFAPIAFRLATIPAWLPLGMPDALWLSVAHAAAALSAGAFGFLSVLAIREVAYALLGATLFRPVSALLQGGLLVLLTASLLLLPAQSSHVAERWLSPGGTIARISPPLWFVGVHESMAGAVFDELPHPEPQFEYLRDAESRATTLYRRLRPSYGQLASTAATALALSALIATIACLWNTRRLPTTIATTERGRGWIAGMLNWSGRRIIAPTALQRAGFFFALQAVARRASHRFVLAAATALGLSMVVVASSGLSADEMSAAGAIPVGVLAAQSLLIASVLTGYRQATRMPAELRATSTFNLAWRGRTAEYVSGVRRAAWVAVVVPALGLLAIWHVLLFGPRIATLHMGVGVFLSHLLLQALFLRTRRVPLASPHVPDVDAKSHAIAYGVALVIASLVLAAIERWSFAEPLRYAMVLGVLSALAASLAALDRAPVPENIAPLEFDDAPAQPTQRLNLAG